MKKIRFIRICTVLASMVLLLAVLAGCGGQNNPDAQSLDAPQDTMETPQTDTQTQQADTQTSSAGNSGEDGALCVSSVEELIEAIEPGAEIVLAPGKYNLTDYLAGFPNTRDWDAFNDRHEYVQIEGAYDGLELVVRNVTGLYIEGGSEDPADTEIVIEPRYANVLGFDSCSDIELACLTMGHTDGGECCGSVLDFYNCQDICLRTMDLYGCGAYGVNVWDGYGDFAVSNSTIRDCSYGPFMIYMASGNFTFNACTLTGSEESGTYYGEEGSTLSFVGCYFGQEESTRWYWYYNVDLDESITFEECEWTGVTGYPDFEPWYDEFYSDYEEYTPVFDADTMTEISFDKFTPNNSYWSGYSVVDPRSGDTYCFNEGTYASVYGDYATLFLDEDGTARLTYRCETIDLEWAVIDENLARLENAEHRMDISLYENSEDTDCEWLLMQYDNELIWFYYW